MHNLTHSGTVRCDRLKGIDGVLDILKENTASIKEGAGMPDSLLANNFKPRGCSTRVLSHSELNEWLRELELKMTQRTNKYRRAKRIIGEGRK